MRPALAQRTAPDPSSGAVSCPPRRPRHRAATARARLLARRGGERAGYPEAMVTLDDRPGPHGRRVLSERPVRPARRDAARPAVPDGARLRRSGQGARAVRHARPGRRSRPPTPRPSPTCARPRRPIHRYGRSMAARIQAARRRRARRPTAATPQRIWPAPPPAPSSSPGSRRCPASVTEGPDLRGPARQAARRAAPGWEEATAPTPRPGRSARWPTSSTPSRCRRCATSRRRPRRPRRPTADRRGRRPNPDAGRRHPPHVPCARRAADAGG